MADAYFSFHTLQCSKCKKRKPPAEFQRRANRLRGRHSWCKECMAAHQKQPHCRQRQNKRVAEFRDRLKTRDINEYRRRERRGNLKRLYGLSEDEYDTMLSRQGGLCAICRQPPTTGRGQKLHVDHDHQTGKIRELLCDQCNHGLGGFKDNPALLHSAIQYLQRSAKGGFGHMRLTIPVEPEIRAKASSTFDVAMIERRLEAINERSDVAACEERAYLMDLLRKRQQPVK